jgi:hypothetical protein
LERSEAIHLIEFVEQGAPGVSHRSGSSPLLVCAGRPGRRRNQINSYRSFEHGEADPDHRIRLQSNYGPTDEKVRVRSKRGVFVPEGSASPVAHAAAEAPVDEVLLKCLDAVIAQGRYEPMSRRRNPQPINRGESEPSSTTLRAARVASGRSANDAMVGAKPCVDTSTGPRAVMPRNQSASVRLSHKTHHDATPLTE